MPFDRLVQATDTELVRKILHTLPEREKAILALRFGLEDGEERTLEEVGQRFGLTRERIRQLQEIALKKLRARMEQQDCSSAESEDTLVVAA